MPTPTRIEHYTVGWICALEIEYLVACELLDEEYGRYMIPKVDNSRDPNTYTFGRIHEHNVVIACLPKGRYGTHSTAVVAERMRSSFPALRFGLMVGIAGGAPSIKHDIRLGDVVVSSPTPKHGGVIQYDFGKAVQENEFEETGHLAPPPEILLNALSHMSMQHKRKGHHLAETILSMVEKNPRLIEYGPSIARVDRLYLPSYIHDDHGECDCQKIYDEHNLGPTSISNLIPRIPRHADLGNPSIHYGLIASANRLMKNALVRDALSSKHDVLCFEMEAAGLMNTFPCVVIRGICDYSDTHKNDIWQPYAAASAAAYAKELLGVVPAASFEVDDYRASTGGNIASSSQASFDTQEPIRRIGQDSGESSRTSSMNWLTSSPMDSQWATPMAMSPPQSERETTSDYQRRPLGQSMLPRLTTYPTGIPRKTLTDEDRRRLCQYHEDNPTAKQTEIGALFGVERSTVSKILRQKSKYLPQGEEDDMAAPINKLGPSLSDIERSLSNWLRNRQKLRRPPSDREIRERAGLFALAGGKDFSRQINSFAWLENFKLNVHPSSTQSLSMDRSTGVRHSRSPPSPSGSASYSFTETSTEVYEYNDGGQITRRTISRTNSRSPVSPDGDGVAGGFNSPNARNSLETHKENAADVVANSSDDCNEEFEALDQILGEIASIQARRIYGGVLRRLRSKVAALFTSNSRQKEQIRKLTDLNHVLRRKAQGQAENQSTAASFNTSVLSNSSQVSSTLSDAAD